MKRILALTLLAVAGAASLYAQPAQKEKPIFNPHWYILAQGGVGHTLGEADFGKLLSPAAALSAGRQFTPVWALRLGVSGWEGKGAWFNPSQVYKFNFMQVNANVVVDLANWFGGFRYDRTINPYVFLGVGGNVGFNNKQAQGVNAAGYKLGLLWTGSKFFVAGRAGAGVNFRLSDCVLLGLEVNTNMLPDKFNSKKAGNADWQMNALAGLTFRLGKNHKKAAPAAVVPVAAPAAAAPVVIPAATPETAPAPQPIAEPVQSQKPVAGVESPAPVVAQPVPATEQEAPAPPSPDTYKVRQNIFFAINSFAVRASEKEKIEALAASLKANPQARVSVVGYADAPTGNSTQNYWLSGWRALKVRDALQAEGVGASRIDMNFVGDREQPYSDVEDNRVVICIVK